MTVMMHSYIFIIKIQSIKNTFKLNLFKKCTLYKVSTLIYIYIIQSVYINIYLLFSNSDIFTIIMMIMYILIN